MLSLLMPIIYFAFQPLRIQRQRVENTKGKTTCKIPRPHSKSRQSKCNETACHFICLIKWHSQPNQKQRCSCFRSTALIRIIEISKFNYSVACEWMCIWSLLFSFLYLPPCTRHSSYKNANFKSVSLWHTFSFSAIKMCVFSRLFFSVSYDHWLHTRTQQQY